MTAASNLHSAWAALFVRALCTSGVRDIVISPGSRSTPLVLAAARCEGLRCHIVLDERSAAFFALGQARSSGRPTALLCTSGTAGAHYFPAILEASQSFTPLIVLTADRPWDAYAAGAPQTTDQVKLFGAHVRHYAELGLPDASPSALRAVPRIAAQAVSLAKGPVPGPVHVNARFRKPLEPVEAKGVEEWQSTVDALLAHGAPEAHTPGAAVLDGAIAELTRACEGGARGLVVCGPAPATSAADAERAVVADFARRVGFPLLPEATSQMRFGIEGRGAPVCGAFDAVLRDRAFVAAHGADVIVEIGAPPTSSAYAAYLDRVPPTRRYVLSHHGWNDPRGDATALFGGDPYALLRAVTARLTRARDGAASAWCEDFVRADAAVTRLVAREIEEGKLTEGRVARDLVLGMPENATLVVSNSNVVRDLDLYAPASRRALRVLHQRGANGIDGLISSAAGARSVADAPTTLLVGDLAFAHDVGGLAAARLAGGPLPIVVVQNRGGRIFEQLPVFGGAMAPADFERLFATPQALDLERAAAAFGLEHRRVESPSGLAEALRDALLARAPIVIEAIVPPHDATLRRAKIWSGA